MARVTITGRFKTSPVIQNIPIPKKSEEGLTRNQLIQQIAKSPHGDLVVYEPYVYKFAGQDPDFLSHFIAWDEANGQIRDSKVALPVISLAGFSNVETEDYVENSLAHLAKLSPRELVQAYMFARGYVRNPDRKKGGWVSSPVIHTLGKSGRKNMLDRLVQSYLRAREENKAWLERTIMNFRKPLINLYFMSHTKPSDYAKSILYDKDLDGSRCLQAVANLAKMKPEDAANAIITHRIPFLVVRSCLGKGLKNPLILMAMIDRMTATEIQTNLKMLENMGVNDFPETRSALEKAIQKVGRSTKTTLKTTKAVESVADKTLKAKIQQAQEKQLEKIGNIEGDWLILGDKSGSMQTAIESARQLAGFLAKMVKGKVYLVFFDTAPIFYDVTGKTYDDISKITKGIRAMGGTSIGCGVQYILDRGVNVDGIAVVSDGGQNAMPPFSMAYQRLVNKLGKEVPVYFYKVKGNEGDSLTGELSGANINVQVFDLGTGTDYYSLPNLAKTMSTKVYGLVDQIMETRLIKVADVLKCRDAELVMGF